MEIRHLRLVQKVAETQNLTRAAEELFLSQSALSHQLRELEEELQTQIFVRARKKMLLSPAGKRLLESAQMILKELDSTKLDISRLRDEHSGLLRITTECYTCYHWLSPVLRSFRKEFPGVQIEIYPDSTYQTREALSEGKVDLVLGSDPLKEKYLSETILFSDEMLAVVSPDHPLAGREMLYARDFVSETLLMYKVEDEHSTVLQEYFKPAGVRPGKIYKIQLTEAILEMAKANLGIALLAEWSVKPLLDGNELVTIPLDNPIGRQWRAKRLKDWDAPLYVDAFISHMKAEIPARITLCE